MRRLAAPAVSRGLRHVVAVRSVATQAPEVAGYSIEERVRIPAVAGRSGWGVGGVQVKCAGVQLL